MPPKNKYYLNVAAEFTDNPGPRSPAEGDFSGEEFLNKHLVIKFKEAVDAGDVLFIDLDDTEGYATSFLESTFGGLVRDYGYDPETVLKHIKLKSEDEPFLIDEIELYIKEAKNK
jgi:hypothetical protein